MANSIATRGQNPLQMPQIDVSSIDPQDVTYFSGTKGLNLTVPSGALDETWLTDCGNFRSQYGFLITRRGFVLNGGVTDAAPATIMKVVDFMFSARQSVLVRFLTDRLQFWDGTLWQNASGTYTLTGTDTDQFTYTSYNNWLIFSNGVDGMFKFDPTTNMVTKIEGAPACKHLTTFNGRVMASYIMQATNILPYRIQWSVKFDETDWTGIGSGFEDLLSTPGGVIDEQIGVYPITDYTALVVRLNSVWQATETGNVDAPFRFERLYPGLGSKWRDSIVSVPGGIIGFFNDDIYLLSDKDLQKIGTPIVSALRYRKTGVDVYAAYGSFSKEYVFVEYDPTSPYEPLIYHYSTIDSNWLRDDFPAENPKALSFMSGSYRGLTIESSTGTIADAGTDTIISEVDTVPDEEMDSLIVADAGFVWYENALSFTDQYATGEFFTPTKWLTSGLLGLKPMVSAYNPAPRRPYLLDKIHVHGVEMAYESDTALDNCFVRLVDGDGTLQDAVQLPLPATGPKSDEVTQPLGVRVVSGPIRGVGHNVKVELYITDNTNYLKLVALVLGLKHGAPATYGSFQ